MTDQQEQPQMTPEQALGYLEAQINAEGQANGHYGPKSVYVMAQVAFSVLRLAIAPRVPATPPEPPKPKGDKGPKPK